MLLTAVVTAASLAMSAHAQQSAAPPTIYQPTRVERPHTFGLGGSLAVSNYGGSGGFRYFFTDRLGTNVTVGWANGGPNSYGGGSTTFVMPSLVFMITPANFTREIDLRPYVAGGLHYVHGSRVSTGPGTVPGPRNDWGFQTLGGLEMSFKSVKAFTISVEGVYYNIISSPEGTTNHSGFDWTVSVHFYLK